MAAYGAAASLKNTIQRLLQSSRISLVSHSPQILQPAYDEMDRLQKVLLKLDETSCSKIRMKVNALDEGIKEAVWEFEDLLESHILHQILPRLESERDHLSFSVDLQSLQHCVDCFVEMVKMMEEEYVRSLVHTKLAPPQHDTQHLVPCRMKTHSNEDAFSSHESVQHST